MSNLDAFLTWLQQGAFRLANGAEIFYSVFGDGTFNVGRRCIQSYFRAFGMGAALTAGERKVNNAMKAGRIVIEKNYAATSSIFRICSHPENYKLAKKHPYAIEQLRVCHLLTNCYVCLNGNQASSSNTFGVSPPTLEEYLAL